MPTPDSVIRRAGARRAAAVARADSELSRIAGLLLDQGDDANVAQAATDTGIARSTLYRRMDEVRRLREAAARAGLDLEPDGSALLPNHGNPDAPAPQPADTDR